MIRKITVLFNIYLLGVILIASPSYAGTASLSRQELQDFLRRPGNAVASPDWSRQYYDQPVSWHGTVYKISPAGADQPVEILLKVLPDSYLYDTVLMVPPAHPLAQTARVGQTLRFQGVIRGVVDTRLHREVHVTVPRGGSGASI